MAEVVLGQGCGQGRRADAFPLVGTHFIKALHDHKITNFESSALAIFQPKTMLLPYFLAESEPLGSVYTIHIHIAHSHSRIIAAPKPCSKDWCTSLHC